MSCIHMRIKGPWCVAETQIFFLTPYKLEQSDRVILGHFILQVSIVHLLTEADKFYCATPWASALLGRASGFLVHNLITDC